MSHLWKGRARKMTEQDILKKIKASAESVEIPESLEPENLDSLLDRAQTKEKARFSWKAGHLVAAAAVLMIALGVMPIGMLFGNSGESSGAGNENALLQESAGGQQAITTPEEVEEILAEEKQNAGDMYLVAKSDEEVLDYLKARYDESSRYYLGAYDGAVLESAEEEVKFFESATSGARNETADVPVADLSTDAEEKLSYSTTNLQMAGVDESDIVKTNGTHIFVAKDEKVIIFEVKNGAMKQVGTVAPKLDSFSDEVLEMYVDNDKLMLIMQKVHTEDESVSAQNSSAATPAVSSLAEVELCYDVLYDYSTSYSTVLYTYDISNPASAKEIGSMEQDGYYKTSRKIDDIIYLFTTEYIDMGYVEVKNEAALDSLLPLVDGKAISYDCIYLPDRGTDTLVVSSISLDNPSDVVDNILVLNNSVEIYVSNNAMYLYNYDYSGNTEATEIAKFAIKSGKISAVAATTVPGTIRDTFAINESNNKLRVLTTLWDGDNSNNLYILDANLNPEGSIKNIAEGESIYAARYFGDLVYFITYRNIDPLFVADLSDSKNPKILGELEITGYSEYLHMWGEDKLLGIGYETNPESGRQEGIKLVMFDISNPAELSILDTVVLEDAYYSSALSHYKTVLADQSENIIGFTTRNNDKKYADYHVYSFVDGEFKELLETAAGARKTSDSVYVRGLYINDYFYLVNKEEITSFDRSNSYEEVESVEIR